VTLPYVVVIGASAGGVAALLDLTAALPSNFPAVVAVVLHVGKQQSKLPELLTQRGRMPAVHAREGQVPLPGTIYVAPPDHHLLLTPGAMHLNRGARENYARPAIDPLFRTAAIGWRERAIGVVLTGQLDDGTAGLAAIKACGGTAIVQDPDTAIESSMPASALANVAVDHCLPLQRIPEILLQLVGGIPTATPQMPPKDLLAEQAAFEGKNHMENLAAVAIPSTLTCPDCGGSLWEIKKVHPLRYRCHTGHAFTARNLENAQAQDAEHSLWSSLRSLKEREMLLRRLATVAQGLGDAAQAEVGRNQADKVHAQAELLTRLIAQDIPGT
jgi:two-component system chemotaxis response regulator CheB